MIRLALISTLVLLSACVEMRQTQSTSVNGQQVMLVESSTTVGIGVGGF